MEKRKKILFIAPDYYGFNEPIKEALVKFSGADVFEITSNVTIPYINFGERVKNFFSKNLLGVNIKKQKKEKRYLKFLSTIGEVDYFVANRPDLIEQPVMDVIRSKTKKSIAIFWDSMEKIPMQKPFIPFFDVCYSFDEGDCKTYGFVKNTNFHFVEWIPHTPVYDVVFLGTLDKRFDKLLKIIGYIQKEQRTIKAYVYVPPGMKRPDVVNPSIEYITEQIPFKYSYKIALEGKVILDIAHPNQTGLSFRPFDAMALKKKLITDNKKISTYNFYNKNNISIVEDIEAIDIAGAFFDTAYEEVSAHIFEEYSQRNWIKNILR